MTDATEALTKGKIGPLPTPVAVGLGIGGVYFLYTRYKSNQAAAVAATPVSANPYSTSQAPSITDSNPNTDSAAPTGPGITTNQQWAMAVETWLLSQGYNPTLVDGAVRDYLAGNQLDTNEQAVINQALQKFGPLPDPLPPTGKPPIVPPIVPAPKPPPVVVKPPVKKPVAPPPPKKPAPAPPKKPTPPPDTVYKVVAGDTLWGIAGRFYGNPAVWPILYNYNRTRGHLGPNPNLIHVGDEVLIPARGTNGLP